MFRQIRVSFPSKRPYTWMPQLSELFWTDYDCPDIMWGIAQAGGVIVYRTNPDVDSEAKQILLCAGTFHTIELE